MPWGCEAFSLEHSSLCKVQAPEHVDWAVVLKSAPGDAGGRGGAQAKHQRGQMTGP